YNLDLEEKLASVTSELELSQLKCQSLEGVVEQCQKKLLETENEKSKLAAQVLELEGNITALKESLAEATQSLNSYISIEHDYCSSSNDSTDISSNFSTVNDSHGKNVETFSEIELLLEAKSKVSAFLPHRWMCIVGRNLLHVLQLSAQNNKTVQRSLEFSPGGLTELFVHCQAVPLDPFTSELDPPLPLDQDTVDTFVDRVISIVNSVNSYEICSGYDDDQKYEHVWSSCPFGKTDENPYRECRYEKTFRSLSCVRLIKGNKWRCSECTKLYIPIQRRVKAAAMEERSKFTANKFLTEEQKLRKLSEQRREIDNVKKKLKRSHARMQELIQKEGVTLEESLSTDLMQLLKNHSITPAQSIFLQQQVKASQLKNASGMRWHPTLVRFALSIYLTSPTAYKSMRETGMVKLPSSRTLFNYSHANKIEEGIDKTVLEKLAENVQKLCDSVNKKTGKKETHKKYHVLMGDEMHISQNLVFQKSTGKLVGFTTLDTLDREVKMLEQVLDNSDQECEETIASKIMVFMVKGVSNGIKKVIATYAVGNMSAVQMKKWTWEVIGALERSGVAVVAFVCDGSSINRSFINSHQPATTHLSGIVFDTINKCARNRKLYFLSDVPHLLKTIRNCFLNSRWDGKKSRRHMIKNKCRISWDHVIKLYESKSAKTLRKSYKLNAMNVYPDSYARMKVKFAGQVMSNTVSEDLISQGWPEVVETAHFIKLVNDWFDSLNGAHSSLFKKKNNPLLAPYTSKSDNRFQLMEKFLTYLEEWEYESRNPNYSIGLNATVDEMANLGDDSEIDEGGTPEEETHASRKLLSKQTLTGIKMTTLAFIQLIPFLLDEGVNFINARVLCQDPLEQHFSRLRAGQGGSSHPNLTQSLKRTRDIDIIGDLGMKKKKGNSGECEDVVEVTTEKLPKIKCSHKPKFMMV
ncbi:Transposable element P transposase, partial [Frankliniella fusca]